MHKIVFLKCHFYVLSCTCTWKTVHALKLACFVKRPALKIPNTYKSLICVITCNTCKSKIRLYVIPAAYKSVQNCQLL